MKTFIRSVHTVTVAAMVISLCGALLTENRNDPDTISHSVSESASHPSPSSKASSTLNKSLCERCRDAGSASVPSLGAGVNFGLKTGADGEVHSEVSDSFGLPVQSSASQRDGSKTHSALPVSGALHLEFRNGLTSAVIDQLHLGAKTITANSRLWKYVTNRRTKGSFSGTDGSWKERNVKNYPFVKLKEGLIPSRSSAARRDGVLLRAKRQASQSRKDDKGASHVMARSAVPQQAVRVPSHSPQLIQSVWADEPPLNVSVFRAMRRIWELQAESSRNAYMAFASLSILMCLLAVTFCALGLKRRPPSRDLHDAMEETETVFVNDLMRSKAKYLPMFKSTAVVDMVMVQDKGSDP